MGTTQQLVTNKNINNKSSLPDINLYSLNPIVVPSGEFKNPYAMDNDVGRHSILAISRGSIAA